MQVDGSLDGLAIRFNQWDTASDYTVPLRTLYSEYSKTPHIRT